MSGGDEQSPINSIMLRPGCKVKIQAGYSPILDESNTIFVGRITNVDFQEVTTIELMSDADVMEEPISEGVVTVFTGATVLESRTQDSGLASIFSKDDKSPAKGITAEEMNEQSDVLLSPVSRLKGVVGEVLSKVTYASRLNDYTVIPDVDVETDRAFSTVSPDAYNTIKQKVVNALSSGIQNITGTDFTIYHNRQLLENVNISNSTLDTTYAGVIGTAERMYEKYLPNSWIDGWISYNESAWQTMQEINLLLPNYVLTTRPFDTRATLVWGHEEGYYRYRRTFPMASLVATCLYPKLLDVSRSNEPKYRTMMRYVDALTETKKQQQVNIGNALDTWVIYDALKLYNSVVPSRAIGESMGVLNFNNVLMHNDIPVTITDPSTDARVGEFMYSILFNNAKYDDITNFVNAVNTGYREALIRTTFESTGKEEFTRSVMSLKLKDITSDSLVGFVGNMPVSSMFDFSLSGGISFDSVMKYDKNRIARSDMLKDVGKITSMTVLHSKVLFSICLEYAAENIFNYMMNIAATRSGNHRRIVDMHVKTSGIDIVDNSIQLNQPYNCVDLTFPDASEEPDDAGMSTASDIVSPSTKRKSQPFPIHYKLKPYTYKSYAYYFKNANIMSYMRSGVISTAVSSILSRLISDTYSGTITLVGDPTIRAHDKILINDYNSDMYGFVRVKSHTLKINAQEGFISVIEPRMVTRADGKLKSSLIENALSKLPYLLGFAAILLSLKVGGGFAKRALRRTKIEMAKGTAGISGSLLTGLTRVKNVATGKMSGETGPWTEKIKAFVARISDSALGRRLMAMTTFNTLKALEQEAAINRALLKILKQPASLRRIADHNVVFIDTMGTKQAGVIADDILKEFTLLKNATEGGRKELYLFLEKNGLKAEDLFVKDDINNIALQALQSATSTINKETNGLLSLKNAMNESVLAEKISIKAQTQFEREFEKLLDTRLRQMLTDTSINNMDIEALEIAKLSKEFCKKTFSVGSPLTNGTRDAIGTFKKNVQSEVDTIAGAKPAETASRIEKAEYDAIREILHNDIESATFGSLGKWDDFLKTGKSLLWIGTKYLLADYLLESGRDLAELALTVKSTADSVTLAPMWFRGEPFLAGLEGMTKLEGDEAGLNDILKARWENIGEGFKHTFDSYEELLYQARSEIRDAGIAGEIRGSSAVTGE